LEGIQNYKASYIPIKMKEKLKTSLVFKEETPKKLSRNGQKFKGIKKKSSKK
jgi:hypothetical protein